MLRLLRRFFGADGSSKTAPARRPATADVLARRPRPSAGSAQDGASAGAERSQPGASFDPYNTGVFDRSASWERVGRR